MVIGVIIPPDFETDPALVQCAAAKGLYWSFINADKYSKYDEAEFKEALTDWGFFGRASARPSWLSDAHAK